MGGPGVPSPSGLLQETRLGQIWKALPRGWALSLEAGLSPTPTPPRLDSVAHHEVALEL